MRWRHNQETHFMLHWYDYNMNRSKGRPPSTMDAHDVKDLREGMSEHHAR